MNFDCHMHTHLCGHAFGDPEDFVDAAADQGLNLITFTCHIPMHLDSFGGRGIRMTHAQLDTYLDMLGNAQAYGEKKSVEVLIGIEAEFFPDRQLMAEMEETLQYHPWDFVLGSVHHQMPVYRQWMRENGMLSDTQIINAYFDHLAQAAESGRYDSLSHPDVIRLYGTLSGRFIPEEHEEIIDRTLERISQCEVCMEVNTSGLSKGDYVVHPDPFILQRISKLQIPLTIGSDAHSPDSVGKHFTPVRELLHENGIKQLHYFRNRKRLAEPIQKSGGSLAT